MHLLTQRGWSAVGGKECAENGSPMSALFEFRTLGDRQMTSIGSGRLHRQVERDANGELWAVPYQVEHPTPQAEIARERVPSECAGKRVVAAMVIGKADTHPEKSAVVVTRRTRLFRLASDR